jgi:hypothetical protein
MFTKVRWDKPFIFNSIRLRREWLRIITASELSEAEAILRLERSLPWVSTPALLRCRCIDFSIPEKFGGRDV